MMDDEREEGIEMESKGKSFNGNRSLDLYLHEINKTPLLKKE